MAKQDLLGLSNLKIILRKWKYMRLRASSVFGILFAFLLKVASILISSIFTNKPQQMRSCGLFLHGNTLNREMCFTVIIQSPWKDNYIMQSWFFITLREWATSLLSPQNSDWPCWPLNEQTTYSCIVKNKARQREGERTQKTELCIHKQFLIVQ